MNSRRSPRAALDACRAFVRPVAALALALGLTAGCDSKAPSSASSNAAPQTTKAPATEPGNRPAPFVMPAEAGPADQAWNAIQTAMSSPPPPPAAWADKEPSKADIDAFRRGRGELAMKIAEQAKDFYTRFASDSRAEEARLNEMRLLDAAVNLGVTNALTRLEELEKARLADPNLPEDDRIGITLTAATRAAEAIAATDEAKGKAHLIQVAQNLVKSYPKRPEPYQVLLGVIGDDTSEQSRATLQALVATNVPPEVQEAAQQVLKRLGFLGKPLDLKFTSVEGKEIDIAQYKGKVVLIDFWATWCGPCMRALPGVKKTYSELQPQGFEIVGISFDEDKAELQALVTKEKMTWPQYFDGKGWENLLGARFGIGAIPAMWLVDRKGIVRDLSAGDDLHDKVVALLKESAP